VLLAISLPTTLLRFRSLQQLAIIAGLAVVVILVMTLRDKWLQYRTKSWSTCVGTLTAVSHRKVDGGLNGIDYWKVTLEYSYRVLQEHSGEFSFTCATEGMAEGAVAALQDKTVCVHYKRSNEANSVLWYDEVWDIWWDPYWNSSKNGAAAAQT
jgi:hypothetical protein